MDLNVLSSYLPLYVEAFLLTVKIGWIGIIIAVLIGVIVAFIIHFNVPVLKPIAKAYVELFRYLLWPSQNRYCCLG